MEGPARAFVAALTARLAGAPWTVTEAVAGLLASGGGAHVHEVLARVPLGS